MEVSNKMHDEDRRNGFLKRHEINIYNGTINVATEKVKKRTTGGARRKRTTGNAQPKALKTLKLYEVDPETISNEEHRKRIVKAIKLRAYRIQQKEKQRVCFQCRVKKCNLHPIVLEFINELSKIPDLETILAAAKGKITSVDVVFH